MTKIEAYYNGQPPYDEEELRNAPRGQWLTNLMFENADLLLPSFFDKIEPSMNQPDESEKQSAARRANRDRQLNESKQAREGCGAQCIDSCSKAMPMPLQEQLIRQEVVLRATQQDVEAAQSLRNGSVEEIASLRVQLYDLTTRMSQERLDLFEFVRMATRGLDPVTDNPANHSTKDTIMDVCNRLAKAQRELEILHGPVPEPGSYMLFRDDQQHKAGPIEYTVEYLGEGESPATFSGRVTSVSDNLRRQLATDQFPQVGNISNILERARFEVIKSKVQQPFNTGDILISSGGSIKVEYAGEGKTPETFTGLVVESEGEFGPKKGERFDDFDRSKFRAWSGILPKNLEAEAEQQAKSIFQEVFHMPFPEHADIINEERENGPLFPHQNQ